MAGTITHKWNGTVLTITSDSGTSSADLKGAKGDDGARGAQGVAGDTRAVAPTIDLTKKGTVTTLTITDGDGVHTSYINDGAAPVKGVDYWTEADKAEMIAACSAPTFVTNTSEMVDTNKVYVKDNYLWIYTDGAWVNTGNLYSQKDYEDKINAIDTELDILDNKIEKIEANVNDLAGLAVNGSFLYDGDWFSGKINHQNGTLEETTEYEETTDYITLPIGATITASGTPVDVYEYDIETKAYIGQLADLSDGESYVAPEMKLVRVTCGQKATAFISREDINSRINNIDASVSKCTKKELLFSGNATTKCTLTKAASNYDRLLIEYSVVNDGGSFRYTTRMQTAVRSTADIDGAYCVTGSIDTTGQFYVWSGYFYLANVTTLDFADGTISNFRAVDGDVYTTADITVTINKVYGIKNQGRVKECQLL